jgi:hypothetical protein
MNGGKNFILYFGYEHIDNIISILYSIFSRYSPELVKTKHKVNNRCLDLNITTFNDLLSNSFNINNIVGGQKIKKNKTKKYILSKLNLSKAAVDSYSSNAHKPNSDRPSCAYGGSRFS